MSEVFTLTEADKAALATAHPETDTEQSFVAVAVPSGVNIAALEARLARMVDALAVNSAVSQVLEEATALPGPATLRALLDREAAWRDLDERYGMLPAPRIAELAGSRSANRSEFASAMRRDGRVIGISRGGRVHFPAFQFGADGRPLDLVRETIAVLRDADWSDESIALWFTAPNGYLDGADPAEVIGAAPDRVVDAARNAAAIW